MNRDYLWDKTGSDAEIEALEDQLIVFRGSTHAAPRLTAVADKRQGRFLIPFWIRTGLATAASALVLAALYLGSGNLTRGTSEIPTVVDPAPPLAAAVEIPEAPNPPGSVARPVEPARVSVYKVRKTIKSKKRSRALRMATYASRTERTKAGMDQRLEEQLALLTKEERYAYDQLMLALSITSSRLKMVQDKVNGFDTPDDSGTTKR